MSWTDLAKCHRKNPDYIGTRDLISMLRVLLPWCVTLGKLLIHSGPKFLSCNNMKVICPPLRIGEGEVKEIMHVKQLTQGLHSPQKINSLLKIKEKKILDSVFLLKKMRIMPQ